MFGAGGKVERNRRMGWRGLKGEGEDGRGGRRNGEVGEADLKVSARRRECL